jgi:hypothetical protein
MTPLARSPDEERRFRGMAFLLDPEHDRSILKSPTVTADGSGSLSEADRKLLRTLLRAVRTRETRDARNMLAREPVRALVRRLAPVLDLSELEEASAPGSLMSAALLRRILKAELLLSPTPRLGTDDSSEETVPWSRLVASERSQPTGTLTLETITEFDPREHFFRDGNWATADAPPPADG